MSAVEDVRKVVQDFLAPEVRELKAQYEAIEKRLDGLDKRMDGVEATATRRHSELMEAIRAIDVRMDRRVDSILDYTQVRERLALLEAERGRGGGEAGVGSST